MNYVSKQVADGLKEIGFDEPCATYYEMSFSEKGNSILRYGANQDWNEGFVEAQAAPDFLTVADWMWETFQISFTFTPSSTHWTWFPKGIPHEMKKDFKGHDHRNAALAHAIQIVKRRKDEAR